MITWIITVTTIMIFKNAIDNNENKENNYNSNNSTYTVTTIDSNISS